MSVQFHIFSFFYSFFCHEEKKEKTIIKIPKYTRRLQPLQNRCFSTFKFSTQNRRKQLNRISSGIFLEKVIVTVSVDALNPLAIWP